MKLTIEFRWPIVIGRADDQAPPGTWRVVMYSAGDTKIAAIKALRSAMGYTLRYAKQLVCDGAHSGILAEGLYVQPARDLAMAMRREGCEVKLEENRV